MINEDKDTSLVNGQKCPNGQKWPDQPLSLAAASLPPFIQLKFNLQCKKLNLDYTGIGTVDTASTYGLICSELLDDNILSQIKPTGSQVNGVGGEQRILGSIFGTVCIGGATFPNIRFDVVTRITANIFCLLGQDILYHPSLKTFTVNKMLETITFTQTDSGKTRVNEIQYSLTNQSKSEKKVLTGTTSAVLKGENLKNHSLRDKLEFLKRETGIDIYHENPEYVERMVDTLIEYKEIFNENELGCFPEEVMIKTEGKPINIRPHRINKEFEHPAELEIQDMLKKGIIEKCENPRGWNSPILAVGKKDGGCRLCINLKNTVNRRLCEPDPMPQPAVDDLLSEISDGCRFFSSMDFLKGYWQIKLKKECRHIFSFTWNGVCYQFIRLPFGFTASGSIFVRLTNKALKVAKVNEKYTKIYIDDVAILCSDFDAFLGEHIAVFQAAQKFNLRLKASKCQFLRQEIPFVGRLLSQKGMRPIPEYVEGLKCIKPPNSDKELKSLIGRLVWLKSFIGTRLGESVKLCSFSNLMEPIFELTRKSTFDWSKSADKALNTLKERMTVLPFISYCDPSLPYILCTDASDVALGGILMQKKGTEYRVIAAVSKCFNQTERKWSTTEREAFAVLYCCRKLEYFLGGTHFTVQTDHKSLVYMDRKNFNNSKICRWQSELSRFNFVVEYIEGATNIWADWLSRPGGMKMPKLAEDFTPAGNFYNIEGTKINIYVPSWCREFCSESTLKLRVIPNENVSLHTSPTESVLEYCPTGENSRIPISLAAVLSERKPINIDESAELVKIAQKQREDIFLLKIITEIERNKNRRTDTKVDITDVMDENDHRYKMFCKIADRLFVDVSTGLLMLQCKNKVQLYLPDCLRRAYLYSAHDTLAHCGITRVKQHLSHFYWVDKDKDIEDYVKTCSVCPARKGNYGQNAPKFGHNVKGGAPLDVIYMDYIFLPTSNGFRYCLTIIDSFTRFLRVYPLRKNRAVDTARELVNLVNEFGKVPKVISTDRGSHFTGEVFKELCRFLNIKQSLHCAWRPESSGILERQHRTLKNALFIVSKELEQPWPYIVGQVVSAINAAPNQATKCSPFYAMYGRHFSLDLPSVNKTPPAENALSHGMIIGSQLARVHKLVQFAAEETVAKFDSKVKPVKPEALQKGDRVLIYRPLNSNKEAKFDWIEGFVVVDYNDFSARLKNEATGTLDWVHRTHIKKVHKRPPHLDDDDDDIDSVVFENEVKTGQEMKLEPSSTGGGDPKRVPEVRSVAKVDEKTQEVSQTTLQSKRRKKNQPKENNPRTVSSGRPRRTPKPVDHFNIGSTKGQSYAHVARIHALQ